ncbi:MAG TPA: bifunctional proline dehydrogenase/L-glutamate gamma-semialdehyde dehydrogenase PutA [Beijerinckiaceae bacterium]|nr:bifunctional proline dehydrogenase/L-glutamate gamma-semialdehyde dehydrogenase PutA [Beijerinckiaceae bacterium]
MSVADNPKREATIPPFDAPFAPSDEAIAAALLNEAASSPARDASIDAQATRLIGAIRTHPGFGGIEDILHEYSLSTKEGLALMVLAEALLRVPDAGTADRLIEDKLGHADWIHHTIKSDALLVAASGWALGLSARLVHPGETPEGIVAELIKRLGLPALRAAIRQAMRFMGLHFVFGETIEAALRRMSSGDRAHNLYSFDMLGEGARTAADARRYFAAYATAITAIGAAAGTAALPNRPGISVKLSALSPHFEPLQSARALAELVPSALDLATRARAYDLNFTIDAEEADRLELTLDIFAALAAAPALAGWSGLGLAVQAYQKRAADVIDYVLSLAEHHDRRFMVRLVKGAYWDTEIKRAQERGLADYPVFTRKAMTDLNYAACARKLLAARPRLFPQFATHNALTVATILVEAEGTGGFEFQRLHGMGEKLYEALLAEHTDLACRIYAPVGLHRDLLAYLVRRLLENGANSSFVALAADPAVPLTRLLARPATLIGDPHHARHKGLPLPADLYQPARRNSAGVEFGERKALQALVDATRAAMLPCEPAVPIIAGKSYKGKARDVISPIDCSVIGRVDELSPADASTILDAAVSGARAYAATPVETRARALERAADLLEGEAPSFMALLAVEGGKTIADCISEIREAVDYCRYYAAEARRFMAVGIAMPGPTGEDNRLALRSRGAFLCISPWNFPLAIFMGQVTAALATGNVVVAKPAEQTPLVAAKAIALLHRAGIPASALHLAPGDGVLGAALVADPRVVGVAFTGSTEVAWSINRALAAKDGPIVPLIAETGGINAMIVDATALPEQVVDDVITSAFRSAGQRCSALRLLCLQEDVADDMIRMIAGAAAELAIGDPRDPTVQIGPVIDHESKARLEAHIEAMKSSTRVHFVGAVPADAPPGGLFVAPHIFELSGARALTKEIFGPILHVVRYRARDLDHLIDDIAASGYGLTLGIHSRIDDTVAKIVARLPIGNVYVNHSMIGAVVGTQPFGGVGLSGTGPKAGGPHYLARFCTEQVVSINIAAVGGDARLIGLDDE